MGMACSSTWFLIVTLLAWALVVFIALLAAPQASAQEERGEEPSARALRRAPRRFIVARASRSPALRLYALAPERDVARHITPSM